MKRICIQCKQTKNTTKKQKTYVCEQCQQQIIDQMSKIKLLEYKLTGWKIGKRLIVFGKTKAK